MIWLIVVHVGVVEQPERDGGLIQHDFVVVDEAKGNQIVIHALKMGAVLGSRNWRTHI